MLFLVIILKGLVFLHVLDTFFFYVVHIISGMANYDNTLLQTVFKD